MAPQSARTGSRNELGRLARRPRALSSTGQSSELIIRWFRVRVPEGPPHPRRHKEKEPRERGSFCSSAGSLTAPGGLRQGLLQGLRPERLRQAQPRVPERLRREQLREPAWLRPEQLLPSCRRPRGSEQTQGPWPGTRYALVDSQRKGFECAAWMDRKRPRTEENYPAFCALHKCNARRKRMSPPPGQQGDLRLARGCAAS